MKKENLKFVFTIIILLFIINACQEENCPRIAGVRITNLLYLATKNDAYDYCNLVQQSANGDKHAIRNLCLLSVGDAAGYDHGACLIDIIRNVGATTFIDALEGIDQKQKVKIRSYLDVGLAYGNRYPEYRPLEEVFPSIALMLSI